MQAHARKILLLRSLDTGSSSSSAPCSSTRRPAHGRGESGVHAAGSNSMPASNNSEQSPPLCSLVFTVIFACLRQVLGNWSARACLGDACQKLVHSNNEQSAGSSSFWRQIEPGLICGKSAFSYRCSSVERCMLKPACSQGTTVTNTARALS